MEALPPSIAWKPDVLFLDIQMPRISGLELVGMLDPEALPHIVFVTAFDEYALRAFEEHALDYLLKPLDPARLQRTGSFGATGAAARTRADGQGGGRRELVIRAQGGGPLRTIPCIGHNRILSLPLAEVEYVHSDPTGNRVVASDRRHHRADPAHLEEKSGFLRCHRQYPVNPALIREILLLDGGLAEVVTCGGPRCRSAAVISRALQGSAGDPVVVEASPRLCRINW